MAEMTPKERGRTLSETLLSDIEKTADVQVAARWLINNAAEQIRQAVQVERAANCQTLDDLDVQLSHHDDQVLSCMETAAEDALIQGIAAIRARGKEQDDG